MVLGEKSIRDYLKQGNFRDLFVRELGWDHYNEHLRIELPPDTYLLRGQAEKRGMGVFVCEPGPEGGIPNPATRRKIEKQAAKSVHEHIIVYVDAAGTTQVWQWVKREAGKPDRPREYTLHSGQSGEPLIQRLRAITFTLDEEASLGIVDVAGRVRSAFDVDKVTKRFYDRFKSEHDRFLKFIQGVAAQGDREWYASLMLNRLMFVYFIQKKGFLDGDLDYLRNRLKSVQQRRGQDQFLSFYRYFLLRLFHEGLGHSGRSPELESLLGTVPYLNGGLFDIHQLEQQYADIEIEDDAFERIFDFFDQYEWHLDTRPLRKDNEINPDVLGYIFEKYINQKQMGAYYTKEDITGYISKNTVIPFLFDDARKRCAIAFESGGSVWTLLRDNPDRYIYESVRKGVDLPLPDNIAAGVHDVTKRQGWNRPAGPDYGLPTETWREHAARRDRCYEARKKLATGQISDINDLITYNLDIVQFAEDVIDDCEGPELLRAFYRAIEKVTILDPTCGSGAFLFAALNILEPLYDACLDRMQGFVDELDRADEPHSPHKYKDFRETLADVARHPNREYFIRKSIILNNLYGVDIMEEAVEIAKLRLFLTLVAQVESASQIEPLPDIDFNIRAGNTLVGFATYADAEAAVTSRLDWDNSMQRIRERAQDVERLSDHFRRQQNEFGGEVTRADKQELRRRLAQLDLELDRYLATEYGVSPHDPDAFVRWRSTHLPFHWFVEFYSIMTAGGFDVIIGNPPYVEYSHVRDTYKIDPHLYVTSDTGNLYAFSWERSLRISAPRGRVGFIVPISALSTPRMESVVQVSRLLTQSLWASHFAVRPGKLFVGVDMNLTILLAEGALANRSAVPREEWSTGYQRWSAPNRAYLFPSISYTSCGGVPNLFPFSIPRLQHDMERGLLERVASNDRLSVLLPYPKRHTAQTLYYRTAGGRYYKIFLDRELESESKSNKATSLSEDADVHVVIAALSSNLWWWYYTLHFDMYNCKDYMIFGYPFSYPAGSPCAELSRLGSLLVEDLLKNAESKTQEYATTGARQQLIFVPSRSKPIIDRVDCILAEHYGLSEEELDFVVNYDLKYRIGQEDLD